MISLQVKAWKIKCCECKKLFLPHCVHTIHYSFWEKEIWNCLHALFQNCSRPKQLASSTCRSLPWTKYRTGAWLWSKFLIIITHIFHYYLFNYNHYVIWEYFFIFHILKFCINLVVMWQSKSLKEKLSKVNDLHAECCEK